MVNDSRHGRKGWLADDDSFSTAVDALASPNTMDSRIGQFKIRKVLRDAGRLGTSTKDGQTQIL
jgi:hypothetical protein